MARCSATGGGVGTACRSFARPVYPLGEAQGVGPVGRALLNNAASPGGGGVLTPSPPLGPRFHRGKKRNLTKGKIDLGHFWYTNF